MQLTITRSLLDEGALHEAMRLAQDTLAFTFNSEKASVLQLLAVVHDRKGEAQAALQCHERAYSILVRCMGSKHHETAISLSHVGVALLAAGNPSEVRHTTPLLPTCPGVCRHVLEPMGRGSDSHSALERCPLTEATHTHTHAHAHAHTRAGTQDDQEGSAHD